MLNFIKKQSVGTWITLGALILAVVSAILYGVNVGGDGYFYGNTVTLLVVMSVLAILMLAAIITLSQFEFKGLLGKILDIVCLVFKILIPTFLALGLIELIGTRVEGLAFIYFSNPEVLGTIQTPANMASAHSAIASFILYGITIVVSIVAAFFGLRKKNKAEKTERPVETEPASENA